MAQQSYFPGPDGRTTSPEPVEFSVHEKQLNVEDVQEQYIEQKDKLVGAIDSTKSLLGDLRTFNKDEWVVRYPQLSQMQKSTGSLRRSMSFADDPSAATEVVMTPVKKGLTRSLTLASVKDGLVEEDKLGDDDRLVSSSDFHVLRLDLKLGLTNSATSLVSQLEKASIANLLDERIAASVGHMDKLRLRVEDTSSKVLVTGDLNAGKSTFVNALLRREVMPVDQQPCTTAFCEVHDAAENGGKEEVHILKDNIVYSITDDATFTRKTVADLEGIIAENETTHSSMLKLYLADTRAPSESLLNNGVVDISLIDAPGLNRDSLKTTAVFARQEEIDVIVFVVSAENHFTLSAKEFLWNASNEKAYLFIVVNKYEQIKNKEKCKRLVLEQIKQLSPRTYEDAEDLVHFVDSASALQPSMANPAFDDLEASLSSFVLVKRSKSKLQPVSTYLSNLLSDVDLLASSNAIVAEKELKAARENLDRARPILEKMKAGREALEDGLEATEEEGAAKASTETRKLLDDALERVSQGKLGVDQAVALPSYPGLLGIWDYARDVRKALLSSLDLAVKLAEDGARVATSSGVSKISKLGDEHLPEGVEKSRRVFMPEAMFSARTGKNGRPLSRRTSTGNAVVAGGYHGLGLGLAQRSDLLEVSFFDLFDAHHHLWVQLGGEKKDKLGEGEEESSASALSLVSVGLGAAGMVGGQAIGARGIIEGIVRITDLFGNETARKWTAPVLGAITIGATAYFIMELPSTIPRTVGRRIRTSLLVREGNQDSYVSAHSGRISRETRKVLRLASWDLREKFRGAMEESSKEVKGAEESEKRSTRAKEFFVDVGVRTTAVRTDAGLEGRV